MPGRDAISSIRSTRGAVRDAVDAALDALDAGRMRVAEKRDGEWHVHQWLKKAVLLSFRLNNMFVISGGPGGATWWDKVDSKFKAGTMNISAPPDSAPCPALWCDARHLSERVSC